MILVELAPTISIERGDSSVWQCAQCGALVCHHHPKKPAGPCSSCGSDRGWWGQDLPVGPFRSITDTGEPEQLSLIP